ncbi:MULTISPECIES: sigma-70 family RNA polymerase sigma factor [Shewanella]|uniref:Sigma-70 family RNA polymerase sigma factor n=1 Tax=Shewanella indica TaxID=768528 RepID=A0ABU4QGI5_9GAMM|nr:MULTISPECIES: sigma-70 family RNA polymerase sigma factor [Shewanella]MDX6018527.1 sigma-70 family RNA polymerase sigma factor [Shewanella indica]NDO74610.1 sigma-70 family RNA polymerase sigma factor [Shewanella sp. SE1]
MPSGEDETWMLAYAAGDAQAFERLYLKHKGGLYRYFVRQLSDMALAEDLYQETWSRVIKAAQSYQPSAKFTTWLYRIAHNLLIDHVRAVKPVDSLSIVEDEPDAQANLLGPQTAEPDSELLRGRQVAWLKECIGLLPQVQKEAFLLNQESGLTAQLISEVVGATLEATKSRIRYAYQSLRDCLGRKTQESIE